MSDQARPSNHPSDDTDTSHAEPGDSPSREAGEPRSETDRSARAAKRSADEDEHRAQEDDAAGDVQQVAPPARSPNEGADHGKRADRNKRADQGKGKDKPPLLERLKALDLPNVLGEHLGLDLRSVGLFRIALGSLVVSDVYHRALHMTAHYTDLGFMPRDKLLGGWSNALFYSFHNWGGDLTSQTILFVLSGIFGLMLLVGYKTRLACIMTYLLMASVQGRNYLILQGGDDLLRVMTFWSMFVPLGARFSIDAALAAPSKAPKRIFSIASTTLAVQLLVMYAVSGILKRGPTWHRDGSAIHLALHHQAFATPFGQIFRELPAPVLQGMTWSVYYLELLGPLLFFLPYKNHLARTLQAFLFIGFHFGLFLTMELGHFPWVAMGAWLMMFPSWFWDEPVNKLLIKLDVKARLVGTVRRVRSFIVERRHWFRVRVPRPRRIRPSLPASVAALLLAIYAGYGTVFAAINKGNVEGKQFDPLLMLRLYANWGMFAPNPPSDSGWFIIAGRQKNGQEIDVWNDVSPVNWEKPELPSATYRTQRWRKFLDNIINPRHAVVRPYFLKWVCRDWNENHDEEEQVRSITMYHMHQTVNWPEKTYTSLSKNNLQRQSCPAVPSKNRSKKRSAKTESAKRRKE